MQEYYADQDQAIDRRERKRAKERAVVLSDEATQKQGEELYTKVVAAIRREFKEGKTKAGISCKLRPDCVFDYVINKLKSKGWQAKHNYNDGFNDYDYIDVMAPDPTANL